MFDSLSIPTILVSYVALLFSLSVHEASHATAAYLLEDDTAARLGRMTLNPLAHMDLLGTFVFPVLGMATGFPFIGWAKPVPVNPFNLRNPKVDDILVTLAGPWMNLLLAIVLVGLARVGVLVHSATIVELGLRTAELSLLLCFFNLIPIPCFGWQRQPTPHEILLWIHNKFSSTTLLRQRQRNPSGPGYW